MNQIRSTPLRFGVWLIAAISPLFFSFSANAEIAYFACHYEQDSEIVYGNSFRDTYYEQYKRPCFKVHNHSDTAIYNQYSAIYPGNGTDSAIVRIDAELLEMNRIRVCTDMIEISTASVETYVRDTLNYKGSITSWFR